MNTLPHSQSSVASLTLLALAAVALNSWTTPAVAANGVTELSQTCAVETACSLGDAPGYPITLGRGSYILTSDLSFSELSKVAIAVNSGPSTIDLNGFVIGGDPGTGVLQTAITGGGSVVIKNGGIVDDDSHCIVLGNAGRVENMQLECGGSALRMGEHGIARHNIVSDSSSTGTDAAFVLGETTGYAHNQTNGSGVLGKTVFGGQPFGVNICGDEVCERYPNDPRPTPRPAASADSAAHKQPELLPIWGSLLRSVRSGRLTIKRSSIVGERARRRSRELAPGDHTGSDVPKR